ncbi:hypothetical protein M0R45_009843 [Rubus argutus]|uniref:Uncharacterized protein n=1 Tax=Rubus argutus TaxID=59490 RepID=A0AAW1Y5N7_RUBAR
MYPNRRRKAQLCHAATAVAADHTRAQQVRSDLLHHQRFLQQISVVNAYTVEPSSPHWRTSPPFLLVAAPITTSRLHHQPVLSPASLPKVSRRCPSYFAPCRLTTPLSLSDGMMKR